MFTLPEFYQNVTNTKNPWILLELENAKWIGILQKEHKSHVTTKLAKPSLDLLLSFSDICRYDEKLLEAVKFESSFSILKRIWQLYGTVF